jgi:phospholipid-binding lipoprotein MlaA
MLPFLGPATLRDGPARVADTLLEPLFWYDIGDGPRWGSFVVNLVDSRAQLLQADRALQQAYDPYAFMRDAYLQRRQYLVYDGSPPEESSVEDENWDQEVLKEDEAGAPPGDDASQADKAPPTSQEAPEAQPSPESPGPPPSPEPAPDSTPAAPPPQH